MAATEDVVVQSSLRMGDTVLLYAKEKAGFVFSELSSSKHNSVAVCAAESMKEPLFPNVHFATFKVVPASKFKAQDTLTAFKKKLSRSRELTTDQKALKLQLEANLACELAENKAEQGRLASSSIVYGEKVQLMHTLSKKFVVVNTTKTSRIENTNLRMELTHENSEGCIFKLLPRYKVRSVGDEVRYNDQVKFESVKTEGQFLHVSGHVFKRAGFSVLEKHHELNLSATESALTIIPHYQPLPSNDPSDLRAGGVVRLFHREGECYVSAEGSFAEDPAVVEDVHCRYRHADLTKKPSSSANTYWQFEKERDPRSGEPISWGERCRIKHLPTRRYLAVVVGINGGFDVILKEKGKRESTSGGGNQELETVFSLFPIIQEGDTVPMESYARIKHLQTRTWLHLDKQKKFVRSKATFDPDAPGLKALEWDGADLSTLTATPTMNYDDAFTLEQVTEELLDKFNFVAGVVPVLNTHIQEYSAPTAPLLDSRGAYQVTSALQELAEFLLTPSQRDTKDRQKLLRNLRVLELVIKILGLFKPNAVDKDEQRRVCKACYLVIENYLKGDSRKNENYLARSIDFFKKQVGLKLNAEEVMIEMVEDNIAIVSKMAETEIDYMIEQLVQTKDPRFMGFLGNLCVCAGRPIPSTQNTILDKLVYHYGEEVFYKTAIGGSELCPNGTPGKVYYVTPRGEGWSLLADIAAITHDCVFDKHGLCEGCEQMQFLAGQLELFGKLCKGNNTRTIAALDQHALGHVTFNEALLCAWDYSLQPGLRAKYVELIKVMFVDVGENRDVLENLSLSFVYSDIEEDPYKDTGGEDTVALTGVENQYFPQMKDWILDFLETTAEHSVIASEVEVNELTADVLEVLQLLVKYGYYDDPGDVNDVLKHLTHVLDGMSDLPFYTGKIKTKRAGVKDVQTEQVQLFVEKGGRYEETEENIPIFAIKKCAMEVINLFFNFRFYVRLQRFMYDFRILKGDVEEEEEEGHDRSATVVKAPRRVLSSGMLRLAIPLVLPSVEGSRPPLDLNVLQQCSAQEIAGSQVLVDLARQRMQYLFSQSAYTFEKSDSSQERPLSDILLDLSNYHSDELVQSSLHLLNRMYSSEITLFEKAVQSQLLVTETSQKVFAKIEELLPILRRLLSIDTTGKQRAEVVDILRKFTEMCMLEGDEEEPHPQNQNILYNYGVLSDVLSYILTRAKDTTMMTTMEPAGDDVHTKVLSRKKTVRTASASSELDQFDTEAVFTHCYHFLKALAKNNIEVQRRLYDRMSDLLEANVALASMGELLTEVFTGGPEICLKVREEQVERIFNIIKTENEGRAELLFTLQAMAKVEDLNLPVKRNQSFIIKYFSKHRETFCDHLLGEGAQKQAKRYDLLTKGSDNDLDLHLLLSMTDLLASCAEGENLFIESVCQTVYSVPELLDILAEPYLPPERKRPFARFLVSVYLNTGGDKQQSGASDLSVNHKMWEFLEHTGTVLQRMADVLKAMSPSESKLVRQGLSSASRRFSIGVRRRANSKTPRTKSVGVPFVTGDDGKLLPGLLLYFSDGVLPLLQAFYQSFFTPAEPHAEDSKMAVTHSIVSALLYMCDVLSPHLVHDAQVKLYRGTVLSILYCCQGEMERHLDTQMLEAFEVRTKSCKGHVTTARENYNTTYAMEQELNETFNTFVKNYRRAYEGPNTAQAQILGKFPTAYTDYLDEGETRPGDEYLPLGPSFQEHVKCFMKKNPSSQAELVKPVAERLITQLEISFNRLDEIDNEKERRQQDELDVKCLQILRALIHNELVQIDPDLKENNASGYRKRCISRLHPIQQTVQNFGNAVSRIVPLLSHPSDVITREVLAFLKALLYSGNRYVQEGMQHLLDTREERLFSTMQSLLLNAAITHNERCALLQQVDNTVTNEKILSESPASILSQKRPPTASSDRTTSISKKWASDSVRIDIEASIVGSPPQDETTVSFAALVDTPSHVRALNISDSPLLGEGGEGGEGGGGEKGGGGKKGRKSPHRRRRLTGVEMYKLETLTRTTTMTDQKQEVTLQHMDPQTAEILRFQDSHHIKLALQVLGLMCDGQYRLMQNYLRDQPDNIHTINLVGDVALFIQNFYVELNKDTMELVHLILQTLIEMCVGNYPNQEVVYNRQILEVLNRIFQLDISDHKARGYELEDSVNLKASAVELLEAMLEETDSKTRKLVREIAGGLDYPALHDTLADFYELMNSGDVKKAGFDDEAERGLFRTFHALEHLKDYGVDPGKLEPKETKDSVEGENSNDAFSPFEAWQFCKRQSKSVEVVYKNMEGKKILTRVHFQFKPENELREEVIERVKWKVNRDSPEDKLRDFLDWMSAVKRDTIHTTRLQNHWYSKYIIKWPTRRYWLLIFLTFLLNLFVLISFTVPADQIQAITDGSLENATFRSISGAFQPDVMRWFGRYALYVFGAFHLLMSLWMVTDYFVVNWPNFVLPRIFYKPFKRWKEPPEETYSDVNIFGLQTIYVVVFLLASGLSLGFYGYFYALCTLHIIVNNDILQRVLRSVTQNGVSLLWVAVLGLIVLYIYAVVSFAFLHESVLAPDNDDATLFCETLGQCFISVVRYGLIDNLGLVIPYFPDGNFQVYGLRIIFDISFFIIVTTIGLNIVFGIIVDTFSELRDDRYRTEEDKKAFCFICSLPSHEFERRAKGFDDHVKRDHNMWCYIYYSIYLDTIEVSDHNAIESFVHCMVHQGKLEFFPLLEALSLEKEEDEVAGQLEELKGMVRNVLERFEKEEHEKTRRNKRQEQQQWEEENLYRRGSVDPSASLDYRQRSFEFRQPSFSDSQFPRQASFSEPPAPQAEGFSTIFEERSEP